MTKTIVLVPGAWHGAWAFEKVVALLERAGIRAIAVDLPGHGSDQGPFKDLHGDADRVREILDDIEGEVILVGHSYGGAVITEAGTHPNVAQLVYMCANVPDKDARSVETPDFSKVLASGEQPDFMSGWLSNSDGTIALTAEIVATCLYSDCDVETVQWATSRIRTHPSRNLMQQPNQSAWKVRPSTYIVCNNDMALHPAVQRSMAARCTEVVEWDTGHSPFASRPLLVADFLYELATAP